MNDAPAPLSLLSSSNRPIAQAQQFQAAQNMSEISEVNQTSQLIQNIPTQDRKRPIAEETEKDEVKIPKPDPEDEPLSMLGQNQEDDSFFVESTDESPIADDVKIEAVDGMVEFYESDNETSSVAPSTSTALNSSNAEQLVKIEEEPDECTDFSSSDRVITNVFPRDYRGFSNTPNVFYIENGREYRLRHARDFYPNLSGVVDIKMECRFKKSNIKVGNKIRQIRCPFVTILRSIKTFDPSDPRYFTKGNWRFLPDSEHYYRGMNNCHKCTGRKVGICPDTVYSD